MRTCGAVSLEWRFSARANFVSEGYTTADSPDHRRRFTLPPNYLTTRLTAGLKPTADGFRVRSTRKRVTVTDGPFTETKEVVGGYALIEVGSKEEALKVVEQFIELHRQHWPAFEFECEVRALEAM